MPTRLAWNGSRAAQAQADRAYKKMLASRRPKRSKKVKAKRQRRPKQGGGQRTPSGLTYYQYIGSKEWRAKRAEFIAARGKCEICKRTTQLQVHHKHYGTLGEEDLDDVRILCKDCHAFEHEGKVFGAMDDVTREYLSLSL